MRKAIRHLQQADPVLGALIRQVGPYRIEYSAPEFSTLAYAIISQQLSGKAALTIYRRVCTAACNGCLTPESTLALTAERLRELGLSRQKIAYLFEAAARSVSGELDYRLLEKLSDEEVLRQLTGLKGIGVWTAHMYLIFALRRLDILPSGDLGIRAAMKKVYGLPALPSPREVEQMGQKWRPFASVASWYLWRSLENKAGL